MQELLAIVTGPARPGGASRSLPGASGNPGPEDRGRDTSATNEFGRLVEGPGAEAAGQPPATEAAAVPALAKRCPEGWSDDVTVPEESLVVMSPRSAGETDAGTLEAAVRTGLGRTGAAEVPMPGQAPRPARPEARGGTTPASEADSLPAKVATSAVPDADTGTKTEAGPKARTEAAPDPRISPTTPGHERQTGVSTPSARPDEAMAASPGLKPATESSSPRGDGTGRDFGAMAATAARDPAALPTGAGGGDDNTAPARTPGVNAVSAASVPPEVSSSPKAPRAAAGRDALAPRTDGETVPVAPASPSPDDAPQMPLATRASVPSPDGKSATEERLRQDHPDTPPAKGAATAPAAEADGHGTAPSSGISAAAPSPEAASRGQPSDIAPTAAPAEADPMQPPALDDRLAEARNPGQRAEAIAPRELPRQLTAPVVELIQQGRDGKLDVSLNPEELGRVRLSASTGEGGVNLLLTAERPETLDLLRRHIAALQQELAGLGLEDVTFSFAGQGGRDVGGERAFQQQAAAIESGDGDAVTAERPDGRTAGRGPAGTAPGGLDLRL